MPEARVAGHAIGQPCLSAAQERAFERHARRLGHDAGRLRGGAELVSYPIVPSVTAVRALPAATPGQRRRRQRVFFNPVIELRRSIGQGVHDRLEAAVFADGVIDPADQARTGYHFPFPTRILSVRHRDVRSGESWDLSGRGDRWGLDDRDDLLNVVNVGSLRLEPGATVLVRGNLLILIIQRLICEPAGSGVCQFAILPTPFSVDNNTGPLHGPGGPAGRDGAGGAVGVGAPTAQTWLGARLLRPVMPGAADGRDGGEATAGGDGAKGRTGGASKLAEITIGELAGSLTILATAGRGGDGGAGGASEPAATAATARPASGPCKASFPQAAGEMAAAAATADGADGAATAASHPTSSCRSRPARRPRSGCSPIPPAVAGAVPAAAAAMAARPAAAERTRPSRAPPTSAGHGWTDVPGSPARTGSQDATGVPGRRRRCSSTSAPSSRCPPRPRSRRRTRCGHWTRVAARSSHHL